MRLVHQAAELRDIIVLECLDGVERAVVLVDGMACAMTLEDFLDVAGNLIEFVIAELAECLELRLDFLELVERMLALCAADIVGRGSEAVRLVGVRDDDARVLKRDLAVAIRERVAVEQDSAVLLAHADSELVHDAAVDADELVLCLLRELDHLDHVESEAECLIEDDRRQHLERSRRRKASACRQCAVDQDVEAVRGLVASLLEYIDDAHRVVCPILGSVIREARHRELDDALVGKVHRVDARRHVLAVCDDSVRAERDGAREDMTAIVVRMLANQIDAAWGEVAALRFPAELLCKFLFHRR